MLEDESVLKDSTCWMISTVCDWVHRVVEGLLSARGGKSDMGKKEEVSSTK